MPLLLLAVFLILLVIAVIPLSLIQRYRMGTARQKARGWLIGVNLAGLSLSVLIFVTSAAVTAVWVEDAFAYTVGGLALGGALGIVGLWLTRWEPSIDALHYTPNRWLVLGVTLVVTVRLLYGFVRAVRSWRAGLEGGDWVASAGVAGAMGAGAVVLGYYLVYWFGVRRRYRRHERRPVRRMGRVTRA